MPGRAVEKAFPATPFGWLPFRRRELVIYPTGKTRLDPKTQAGLFFVHPRLDRPAAGFSEETPQLRYVEIVRSRNRRRLFPFEQVAKSSGDAIRSASNRETWAGAQRSRPAGVRMPRASGSWAMAASVQNDRGRMRAVCGQDGD